MCFKIPSKWDLKLCKNVLITNNLILTSAGNSLKKWKLQSEHFEILSMNLTSLEEQISVIITFVSI